MRWEALVVIGLGSCSSTSSTSKEPAALTVKDSTFRCAGPKYCSGSLSVGKIQVTGPTGTRFRVGGTEFTLDTSDTSSPSQIGNFSLDMIRLADEIGITATIEHDKPVAVPVEVELPGQPKLQATMEVQNGVFADLLVARLSSIATRPLTRRDDTTEGALVVVGSHLRAYGTDRPRSAKVIVLGKPTSRSKDCGSYRNVKTGEQVKLTLHAQEVALQAYDPATGTPLGKATADAKLTCPDETKAESFFGKANTDATFDEESVEHAVKELR